MDAQHRRSPRQKRARALDTRIGEALQLRLWLSPSDAARLRDLTIDDEEPAETIRRLIRTGALVQPILAAIEGRTVVALTPAARPEDDALRRQMVAMTLWSDDD